MNRLYAVDEYIREELKSIGEMQFSASDRRDLETAFEELIEPYWIEGSTAYIKIQGILSRRWTFETWLLGGMPTGYLQHVFQKAEADNSVENIMLFFDSPGGEVSGLSEFAESIRESGKPVHAHISGHCTSGAYWLAAQADRITASNTSMIGSIGAFISFVKRKDSVFEQITYRSSAYKAPAPDSDEGKDEYQKLVDQIAALFEAEVAEGRGISVETVQESYGQGKVFLAQEALSLGLIDEVVNRTEIRGDRKMGEAERKGGAMHTENQETTDLQSTAEVVTNVDAAAVERDRIKAIMALGGSMTLTDRAIDEGLSVESAALQVNTELQEEIARLKALVDRSEDASVLDNVVQKPASETAPVEDKKNIFGVSFSELDKELSSLERLEKQEA